MPPAGRAIGAWIGLGNQIPGISFKTSGPGQTEYEIRGLTSTGGESPTVGFYLDETPLTPPARLDWHAPSTWQT